MTNQQDTKKYLEFLSSHPAYINDITGDIFSAGVFWVYNVAKNNKEEEGPICVYRDDKKFNKFKDRFTPNKPYILVTYEEYHNKKWIYDHTVYGGEVCFKSFDGNFNTPNDNYKYDKWGSFQGVRAKGNSFDEMIKNLYLAVVKEFGIFDCHDDSMLTDGEILNHQNTSSLTKIATNKRGNVFKSNTKYIQVHSHVINRRWLRWYAETKSCKKNWKNRFDKVIELTPNWVWDLSKKAKQ